MDVYLVPVAAGRHELYFESLHEGPLDVPREGSGMWKRLVHQFNTMLAKIERQHDRLERSKRAAARLRRKGWTTRLRVRGTRWLAEKVAEQRLLWRLRTEVRVCARYPSGLGKDQAMEVIRGNLSSDFDRHRWWLAINTLAGIASLALVPFPGPNVIGLYFAFRIVGHFLSVRGARQGLDTVRWDLEESTPLAELAAANTLPPAERERRVREIAAQLGLRRLPQFYARTAANGA